VPLDTVIEFKREVYYKALCELARFLQGMAARRPDYECFLPPPAEARASQDSEGSVSAR
jgi:hypothetical protein